MAANARSTVAAAATTALGVPHGGVYVRDSEVGKHGDRLPHAPPPRMGTLWDLYLSAGGADLGVAPLAVALLSDANVALLTRVLAGKAAALLGDLAPPPHDLVLGRCDAFSNGLMQVALDAGWLAVTPSTLAGANARVMTEVLKRLSSEASAFARWREFLEVGVNPAMAPRPGWDTDMGDRRELQHAPMGHGTYNPWEAIGERAGWLDRFAPDRGMTPQALSGSDDLRIRVVPWAPPAVHGVVPGRTPTW